MQTKAKPKAGNWDGGWICFVAACVIMWVLFPAVFIYGPLFLVSFILGIVAIAQKRVANGIFLILANLVGAPILFVIAVAVGIAHWTGAKPDADKSGIHSTNVLVDARSSATGLTDGMRISPADEVIKGAFGKQLGDVISRAQVIGVSELTDGTPMYEFAPQSGLRSLTHYYVLITPSSRRIHSIWGRGAFQTTAAAANEQKVLVELLRRKYGEPDKEGFADRMDDSIWFTRGKRHICTRIVGFSNPSLEIHYVDAELREIGEKERVKGEVGKAGTPKL